MARYSVIVPYQEAFFSPPPKGKTNTRRKKIRDNGFVTFYFHDYRIMNPRSYNLSEAIVADRSQWPYFFNGDHNNYRRANVYTLSNKMLGWLKENCGHYVIYEQYLINGPKSKIESGFVVRLGFNDPHDAILFNLTWN